MINHIRTLLLNRRAVDVADVVGSEYVPPTYFPVALPPELAGIHRVLYPGALDVFGEQEVTARLMQLLHQPELAQLTLRYDPRVTYDLLDDTIAKAVGNPVTITRFQSPDCDMTLHLRPTPELPASLRAGKHSWAISTGNVESVRIQYGTADAALYDVVPRFATQTDDITLLKDYLVVYLDIPTGQLTGQYRFDVDVLVPVSYNFATIIQQLEAELARPGRAAALFALHAQLPDMELLRKTWLESTETLLRIGAATLALAGQTNYIMEMRNG
jgi:hypothetical protein